MIVYRYFFVVWVVLIMWGCSSNEQRVRRELDLASEQVASSISGLKKHLQAGRVRNAELLKVYADQVKKSHPEYREVVNLLAQDATTSGPLIASLEQRLSDAKKSIANAIESPELAGQLGRELNAIHSGAAVQNFNLALTDPINVLADMSGGKLSRLSSGGGQAAETPSTAPVGSELIGNPNYGQWQTNSSGDTFWEWYGKYALLSSVFDLASSGRFSDWSTKRRRSYYHDYGRDYYSSPSQKSAYQQAETRVKKRFSQQGKQFQSPYARSKTASVKSKTSLLKTPNKFKSTFSGVKSSANSNSKVQAKSNSAYNYRSKKVNSRSFGFGGK